MEQEIIDKVIEVIELKLGWNATWSAFETNERISIDGKLSLKTEDRNVDLACEVKKSIVPSTMPRISEMLAAIEDQNLPVDGTMLLASYISTKARYLLQERKINYADTAGNIFLQCKGWYIHIETGQSNRTALSSNAGRAFTKTGLKVVHQFFRTNKKEININSSYDDIAKEARVSKDTVAKVINDLIEKGYILRLNRKTLKWRGRKELFEKWAQSYNETLRPNLQSRRFRFLETTHEQRLLPKGYQRGGYNAVEYHYDIPKEIQIINPTITFYTHRPLNDAIVDLRLIPDPTGRVVIYHAFWKNEENEIEEFPPNESGRHGTKDDIISYADLVFENDPRYLDIAKLIYQYYFHDRV